MSGPVDAAAASSEFRPPEAAPENNPSVSSTPTTPAPAPQAESESDDTPGAAAPAAQAEGTSSVVTGAAPVPANAAPASTAGPTATAPPAPAPLSPLVPRATGPWEAGFVFSIVPPQALTAIPVADGNEEVWYGIVRGKYVGVTQSQALALNAVLGVSNNSMRGYKTLSLALGAFNDALAVGFVDVRTY
ncbi:hypothetical protein B0H14DRAFT_2647593 [Mycena olivaceomarginata]|nr:hypothetical protein B0H14DRAFT_2647593 [Mycena olivaceomarginata]